MAAARGAFFGREMVAAADGGPYYASSGHGAVSHHHQSFVQNDDDISSLGGFVDAHNTTSALAAADDGGIGMAPAAASFPAVYGAAHTAVFPSAAALHPPPLIETAAPFKGAWTKEEDDILREMVSVHGDRKWATIARYLPGRIGKQCRERWINHLHPGIKKDVWTEEEDMALIEAHRSCGNRWSVIARHLPGRSENSVKNHWNATKRGLKAKRRLRKKNSDQQAAPGQLSLLAEYILSLYPSVAIGHFPAPTSPVPVSGSFSQPAGPSNPPPGRNSAGMYLNPASAPLALPELGPYDAYGGGLPDGRFSYYLPSYAHMNVHYGQLQVPAPQTLQMIGGGQQVDLHAAYAAVAGMNGYLHHPFGVEVISNNLAGNVPEIEYDDRGSSTNQGGGAGYYADQGEAAAGPSSAGGKNQEDMEVVQMASM